MDQWAFKKGTICVTQVCIYSHLTVRGVDTEERFFPFLHQLFWRSALIDLAYPMLSMIRMMEEIKVHSFDVCNPLSWVLVNDKNGVYLTWPGILNVTPEIVFPKNLVK